MEIVMIIVLLIILVGIWVIMTRKKLACLEENVCHAMNQIGVQLDSRARTLEMLRKTTEELAQGELPVSRQYENGNWEKIGAEATPKQVMEQEKAMERITAQLGTVLEEHPEWKMQADCVTYLDALAGYEKMMCTSRLIYNDSVTRYNKAVRRFPANLIAWMLGFSRREYIG